MRLLIIIQYIVAVSDEEVEAIEPLSIIKGIKAIGFLSIIKVESWITENHLALVSGAERSLWITEPQWTALKVSKRECSDAGYI